MTRTGDIEAHIGPPPAYTAESYRADSGGPRRKIRRVKLGLLLASLAACLGVTLIGVAANAILQLIAELAGFRRQMENATGLAGGAYVAIQLAIFNFILFVITVPAAWIAMGLSIGRFPHRGIAARMPYLRWAGIWGAILVGGTTAGLGTLIAGPLAGAGALVTGALIGTLAGLLCGLLFHAIVKPAEQLHDADISVF